ncbi:MAG TPA: hypothetical protein VMV25_01920 [Steroidobacteraceae bacterium]|nr:hypothetical protein [Steroidobacteraceae bacterium]
MSMSQLQDKAAAFQLRARRADLTEYLACAAVMLAFGFHFWAYPGFLSKLGSLTMILATLFVAYQLRKHGAARMLPPGSAAVSLLEFHRRELVRRKDLLYNSWRLFVAPLMLGLLVFTVGMTADRPAHDKLPLLILGAAVIAMGVAIGLYNRWQAGELQRDVDELNSLGAAGRGAAVDRRE